MTTRLGSIQLQAMFRMWLKAYDLVESKKWDKPGFYLDRQQNMWKIMRVVKSQYSDVHVESEPFGSRRRTTRELYEALLFAIDLRRITNPEWTG